MSGPDPHVEAMLDALRACVTVPQVNAVVRDIAPAVRALDATDPVSAIHIRNLAAYKRATIISDAR